MKHPLLSAAFLSLFLLSTVPLVAGEVVTDETFDTPLATEQWVPLGAVHTAEGRLLMTMDRAGSNCGIALKTPLGKLNFLHAPVEIVLTDLNLQGSGPADARYFVLVISVDANNEQQSAGYIRLRISGDGKLLLATPASGAPGGSRKECGQITIDVALPIKSLTLKLNVDGTALLVNDASGERTEQSAWNGLDLETWKNSVPSLSLRSVLKENGHAEGSLSGIKILSN